MTLPTDDWGVCTAPDRIYCEFTAVYTGLLWSEPHKTADWLLWWWAEDRDGNPKRFNNEEAARAWLRERARATLGPAWAATVDARALGDAA